MIPFSPECKIWQTKEEETITVSEMLSTSGWDGTYLFITGSQKDDYSGASSLFHVMMPRDLAAKFFGSSRVFSAELHNIGTINVLDKNHFISWAKENGAQCLEDAKAKYTEYKRLFPNMCWSAQSRLRICAEG